MKIRLNKGQVGDNSAIRLLEESIGSSLNPDVLEFIRVNDGAEPDTNTFRVSTANDSGVNSFIPVREILSEKSHIEGISAKCYPIAWAEGGNYVLVDQELQAILFWDHEAPSQPTRLADSLSEFLEMLQPFDVSQIELKPGQVKRAWIDPDFLKEIRTKDS